MRWFFTAMRNFICETLNQKQNPDCKISFPDKKY